MEDAAAKPTTTQPPRKGKVFAIIMTVAAAALLIGVCVLGINASRGLAGTYHEFAEADLSQDFSGELIYDDHVGYQAHYGASIPGGDPDNDAFRAEYLENCLRSMDMMIVEVGIFYGLIVGLLLAFPLYWLFGKRPGRHVAAIAVAVLAAFAIDLACILITHAVCGAPFYFPTGHNLALLAVGLLSGVGGLCALALLLRLIRRERIAAIIAVLAIPAVFLFFNPAPEAGIFASPTVDSFDYLLETDPRVTDESFDGPYYYEERNVLVVGEDTYAPEAVPNPNHFTGWKRALAIAWEVLNPGSGNAIAIIEGHDVPPVPAWALALYGLKALAWIVLPVVLVRRRESSRAN